MTATLTRGATLAALRPAWAAEQYARATLRLEVIRASTANAVSGHVLAEGDGWRWVVYRLGDGAVVAACYVAGRLLRRSPTGWHVVDFRGKREPVKGDPVTHLAGTAPALWPLHPEHVELRGGAGHG